MKFQQLKIGQQFEYQGNIYVKSSPLLASHTETGEQKLIPRYAAIVVTEAGLPSEHQKTFHKLNSDQVQTAFDKFYTEVIASLPRADSVIDTATLESIQIQLENSRQAFFVELGLEKQADSLS